MARFYQMNILLSYRLLLRLVLPFEHIYHRSSPTSEVLSLCPPALRGVAIWLMGKFPPHPHPWLSLELWPGFISWYRISFSLGKVHSNYLCYLTSELHPHTIAWNMKTQIPFVSKLMKFGRGRILHNLNLHPYPIRWKFMLNSSCSEAHPMSSSLWKKTSQKQNCWVVFICCDSCFPLAPSNLLSFSTLLCTPEFRVLNFMEYSNGFSVLSLSFA